MALGNHKKLMMFLLAACTVIYVKYIASPTISFLSVSDFGSSTSSTFPFEPQSVDLKSEISVYTSADYYSTIAGDSTSTSTSTSTSNRFNSSTIPQQQCANWLTATTTNDSNERQVLLVGFQSIDLLSWASEEYHLSLNIIESLLTFGFDLHHIDSEIWEKGIAKEDLEVYHRIFILPKRVVSDETYDPNNVQCMRRNYYHHEIACKIRIVFADVNMKNENNDNDERKNEEEAVIENWETMFHEKQLLLASSRDAEGVGEGKTYLGYYPMLPNEIERPVKSDRSKRGLVIVPGINGDAGSLSPEEDAILKRLLKEGISLHIIPRDRLHLHAQPETQSQPENITREVKSERISQTDILELLTESTFLLYLGNDIFKGLPLIAMALGASVINLTSKNGESQMSFLSQHSMPYVYNVNREDIDRIVETVQETFEYRFPSHIILGRGEIQDRICALMEDDSVCTCPRDGSVDCRSSFYAMKRPPYPSMK